VLAVLIRPREAALRRIRTRWLLALFSAATLLASIFKYLTRGGHVHGVLPRLWGLSFYLPIPPQLRVAVLQFISYSFLVGAVAVIRSADGRGYLLARHRYPIGRRRAEVWGFPGGTVGKYEEIRQALQREIVQELGMRIAVGRLLVVDASERPHLDFFFECAARGGGFRPSSEIAAADYFLPDGVPVGTSPQHLRVLQMIEAGSRDGSIWPLFTPVADATDR
jgi:8-oxo-dGTP pyrophosphatase MutT (NUDIX family)